MSKLPKYKITIDPRYTDGNEELGISAIAFTSKPAILKKGFAFSEAPAKRQLFADDLKYRITAPIMKAMDIYRCDGNEEYYVQFTKEEIDLLHQKFMMNFSNKDKFNDEHRSDDIVPAYLLAIWTENDGDEVWVTTQFTDKDKYHEFVADGKVGYSIEGFLGMDPVMMSEIIEKNKPQEMEEEKNNEPLDTIQFGDYTYKLVKASEEEIKEEEVALEDAPIEEEKPEEAPVEEAPKEEEELAEEAPIEEVPVEEAPAPTADSYNKNEIDAKFDELYKMIGEMKADAVPKSEEKPTEEVKMSATEKLSAYAKFARNNKGVRF